MNEVSTEELARVLGELGHPIDYSLDGAAFYAAPPSLREWFSDPASYGMKQKAMVISRCIGIFQEAISMYELGIAHFRRFADHEKTRLDYRVKYYVVPTMASNPKDHRLAEEMAACVNSQRAITRNARNLEAHVTVHARLLGMKLEHEDLLLKIQHALALHQVTRAAQSVKSGMPARALVREVVARIEMFNDVSAADSSVADANKDIQSATSKLAMPGKDTAYDDVAALIAQVQRDSFSVGPRMMADSSDMSTDLEAEFN